MALGLSIEEADAGVEKEKALAFEAKQLVKTLTLDKDIIIKTTKDKTGKFGRYFVEIFHDGIDKLSVNQVLIDKGLACVYTGSKLKFYKNFIVNKNETNN